MDVSMNRYRLKKFQDTLDNLPISDYYGLNSQGLTCYLNSVLQVLFMTVDFRDAVERTNTEDLDSHLAKLFQNLKRTVTTTHTMVKILKITDVYEQRDAAEYLEKILCLTSEEASKIFKGEWCHNIKCLKCNEENRSSSSFWILPISMGDSEHKTYDVEEGLKAFFEVQNFSRDNQLYCTRCKEKQDADIRCEITKTPGVFTLLLKRFTFDYRRRRYVKLDRGAVVPKTLSVKKCSFELYAVVNHYGSLTGGHYTADINSFETNHWYCFDDDVVRSLKPQPFEAKGDSLSSSTAYLLIYKKVKKGHDEADGRDLEAHCTRSNVEAEKRHEEAKRGESPKPLNGGLEEETSCDYVNRRSVNTTDQGGAFTRGARSPQDNKNCCVQNTSKPKPQERSSRQKARPTGIAQEQTSTRLRNNEKCERRPKEPWR